MKKKLSLRSNYDIKLKKNFLKANMYFFIECNRKISDAGKVLMSYVNTKSLNKNNMFCLEE